MEEDWDYDSEQWYEWTFSVKLPIFEEYRNSNSANEQSLLEVMKACKTLVEIYDDVYDDLDFEFRHEDARIVMHFSGGNFGSLKIHDTSTSETFYYEEHGENRYLHSVDTEYVLTGYDESDFELDDYSKCTVGDVIKLGRYEQDGNTKNGDEAIEWIVLEVNDGKALVVTKYAIEVRSYNHGDKYSQDASWNECSLREWLNDDFLVAAFNQTETDLISIAETSDKVFLLSVGMAQQYFSSDSDRQCQVTTYAKENGASEIDNNCWWWLESAEGKAIVVGYKGDICDYGNYIHIGEDEHSVRPAMWIEIND